MKIFKGLINRLYKRKYSRVLKRIKGYETIEGWLTPGEAYGLYNMTRKLPGKSTVVEIGSWKGKSTFCIASGLRKGFVHAIDPFDGSGEKGSREIYGDQQGEIPLIDQFRENTAKIKTSSTIEIHRGYSKQVSSKFKKIDLLFIDGDHSIDGCQYDFETFSDYIHPGGFLVFHDYYPERTDLGPTHVIENLVLKDPRFRFYRRYDSLWIAKRI